MKDSKFIELLNLYVDHEIAAADAALLEAEVQRNPQRRQIYREYCQMQQACTQLTEKFRTAAPAPAIEPGKVVEVFPRRRLAAIGYIGGFAAAACAAVVVLSWNRNRHDSLAPRSAEAAAPIAMTAPATPTSVPVAPSRPALQPAFGGSVRESARPLTLLAGVDRADRPQLDWINGVRLQRVSLDQLTFDAKPEVQPADYLLRERRTSTTPAEMTAFRFQK